MKTLIYKLLSFLFALVSVVATAQTNIQSAFDAIIKCREAQITESHNLDRNPTTNTKLGQCDIYRFVLPASKFNLIKKVISAFEADSQLAYSFNCGTTMSTDSQIHLAVGDGQGNGIYINEPGCEYMYALFLAPQAEDPEGKFRYAYAMSYKKVGDTLEGKLVITYSTTLAYRQKIGQEQNFQILRNFQPLSQPLDNFSQTWFDMMISCLQGIENVSARTQVSLATKAYNLVKDIKDFPDATKQDKVAIREIIEDMVSNKEYKSNTMLIKILNQCLIGLK